MRRAAQLSRIPPSLCPDPPSMDWRDRPGRSAYRTVQQGHVSGHKLFGRRRCARWRLRALAGGRAGLARLGAEAPQASSLALRPRGEAEGLPDHPAALDCGEDLRMAVALAQPGAGLRAPAGNRRGGHPRRHRPNHAPMHRCMSAAHPTLRLCRPSVRLMTPALIARRSCQARQIIGDAAGASGKRPGAAGLWWGPR